MQDCSHFFRAAPTRPSVSAWDATLCLLCRSLTAHTLCTSRCSSLTAWSLPKHKAPTGLKVFWSALMALGVMLPWFGSHHFCWGQWAVHGPCKASSTPQPSIGSAWSVVLNEPCTHGLKSNFWRALTVGVGTGVQPPHGQAPAGKVIPGKTAFEEQRCQSVWISHFKTKLVLTDLIWVIAGFRRSRNDCTFQLWCFCQSFGINTLSSQYSAKKRGQRANNPTLLTFPRYGAWDHCAPSREGTETGYSAKRTAP